MSLFRKRTTVDSPPLMSEESIKLTTVPHSGEKVQTSTDLYIGMQVTLIGKTEDKSIELDGRIDYLGSSCIRVSRNPGTISLTEIPIGTSIILHGVYRNMHPVALTAIVEKSSRIICELRDIAPLIYVESRYSYRLPMNKLAHLTYMDSNRKAHNEEVRVVNISEGGSCVISKSDHEEGELVHLSVKIDDSSPVLEFDGEIVRVVNSNKGLECGVLFAQLSASESDTVVGILHKVQAIQYHEAKEFAEKKSY